MFTADIVWAADTCDHSVDGGLLCAKCGHMVVSDQQAVCVENGPFSAKILSLNGRAHADFYSPWRLRQVPTKSVLLWFYFYAFISFVSTQSGKRQSICHFNTLQSLIFMSCCELKGFYNKNKNRSWNLLSCFQVVDLYWGVDPEEWDSPELQRLRMKLLEECLKTSAGPCFVVRISTTLHFTKQISDLQVEM